MGETAVNSFRLPHSPTRPQTSDITIHNGRGHIKVEQVGGVLDVWNGVGDVEMMGVLSTNAQLTTGRGNVVYAGKVFAGGKYTLDRLFRNSREDLRSPV